MTKIILWEIPAQLSDGRAIHGHRQYALVDSEGIDIDSEVQLSINGPWTPNQDYEREVALISAKNFDKIADALNKERECS